MQKSVRMSSWMERRLIAEWFSMSVRVFITFIGGRMRKRERRDDGSSDVLFWLGGRLEVEVEVWLMVHHLENKKENIQSGFRKA